MGRFCILEFATYIQLNYVAFAGIIVEWWVGRVGLSPFEGIMG